MGPLKGVGYDHLFFDSIALGSRQYNNRRVGGGGWLVEESKTSFVVGLSLDRPRYNRGDGSSGRLCVRMQ